MTTKNPVIKRGRRYYNTLTNKYVNVNTAKRINSFFKRNPEATLYEAYGRSKYRPSTKWPDQPKGIIRVFKRKTQIVQTRSKTGKITYYSPISKKRISVKEYIKLQKFDYKKGLFKIQLFRLTVDRGRVYHIITTKLKWQLEDHSDIDRMFMYLRRVWLRDAMKIVREVHSKYPLSKNDVMHTTFAHDIYDTVKSEPGSVTVMEQLSPKTGLRFFPEELERAEKIYHILLNNYRIIIIHNVKIFIYSFSTPETRIIAESRLGIFKKQRNG